MQIMVMEAVAAVILVIKMSVLLDTDALIIELQASMVVYKLKLLKILKENVEVLMSGLVLLLEVA